MPIVPNSKLIKLSDLALNALKGQSSVSGLSSGAFMTVQLHIAHSASFVGAGVIAGGPYRAAQSYRASAALAADAAVESAFYNCMTPLDQQTAPSAAKLAAFARQDAAAGLLDDLANLAKQRVYIFTGTKDEVVYSPVVNATRLLYEILGVPKPQIRYVNDIPSGHAIITDNPEDSPLGTNQPPYINNGGFMQSHDILNHIYPDLKPPVETLTGRLLRFDQGTFLTKEQRASLSPFGYLYVPQAVLDGAPARIHIALHGCKQGYDYRGYIFGREDTANQAPYGDRYFTTTGYNHIADANNIVVLYPQVNATDNDLLQNPEGCWDWWGYTSADPNHADYYSREAVQIKILHDMLTQLGG